MINESIVLNHSQTPQTFLAYNLFHSLAESLPDQTVIEVSSYAFDFEDFAKEGFCQLSQNTGFRNQVEMKWCRRGSYDNLLTGLWDVQWQGQSFQIVQVYLEGSCGGTEFHWIIAQDPQVARDFFEAVCRWNDNSDGVIQVFSQGYWHRSRELYASIQSASMDALILPEEQKQGIISDFERFLKSRDRYEKYGATWKRGVIFIGPPGNGKTQFIRALIKHLGVACFYVKSFETGDKMDSTGIQAVYDTVRRTNPAILVLEDLDSLICDENRSYFLNELDGLEENHGLITIATTNYPEKLDPAILDRPSRFDQKWFFGLPDLASRQVYFELWNAKLPEEVRLNDQEVAQLASLTEEFSFAYLKELCLGGILKWVQEGESTSLVEELKNYKSLLKRQNEHSESQANEQARE